MSRSFKPSLRSALTSQAGLVIFLAVIICAASLFLFSVEEDHENLDASLLRQAKVIGRILGNESPGKDTVVLLRTLLASEPDHRMAEIRLGNGKILHLGTHSKTAILLEDASPSSPIFVTKAIGDRNQRIIFFPFQGILIAIAAKPESIREILQNVLLLYGILTVFLLLIIFTGGRWLANRALAPLAQMADATARITSLDSAQRLPTGQSDQELHRLASVLNDLLDRLHASFALVRRFTADAAHEIKTPLAIIHGHLESALHVGEHSPGHENTLLLTLREVSRLNRLVEGLLLLSRSDASRLDLELQPLDWSALTCELLHDADILCAPLGLEISTDIAPGILISADREYLRQVLLNLLDNACKYNRPGGHIRLSLQSDTISARFEIGNTGPAIPAEAVSHLFERFQRGDASRTRARQEGLGLGLAICREIMRAHGGQIELVQSENDLTLFRVTLFKPLA